MDDKTCNIVAQYIRALYATAHIRPYENKSPMSNAIKVELSTEPLEQPGYYRVELAVHVEGSNSDGTLCFETGAGIEGIVSTTNLTPEELDVMLGQRMPGLLLGSVRAAIATASLSTGYGPITLPPLTGAQLLELSRKPQEE